MGLGDVVDDLLRLRNDGGELVNFTNGLHGEVKSVCGAVEGENVGKLVSNDEQVS